ncbi:MAG: hypothetical protein GY874_05715 [Desulfobacteraceae bacterium]|nr:hypothetical protein [Desulfobacteraceae bacterium]
MKRQFLFSIVLSAFIILTVAANSFGVDFDVSNISKNFGGDDRSPQINANGHVFFA